MSAVVTALDERGWEHHVRATDWRTARVQGAHSVYELFFRADDPRQVLLLYCALPLRVPAARRAAVGETINRANYGLLLGNFELDHADGELRFKMSVDVEGSALVPLMVHNMISATLAACDQYFPALVQVLYAGAVPEDAVRAVEEEAGTRAPTAAGAETAGDVDGDGDMEEDADGTTSPEVAALLRTLGVPPGDGDEAAARAAAERAGGAEPAATAGPDAAAVHAAPIRNCYAVGDARLLAGEYPGDRREAAARDKLGRLLDAGVTLFLDLTGEGELHPYAPLLAELAGARAVRHVRLPVRDMDVPAPARMAEILDTIDVALAEGHTVYVHCWGGVGRTGTVVGCHLVRRGHAPEAALAEVARLFATMSAAKQRNHPEGSPQTAQQRAFVRAWTREEEARRRGTPARAAAPVAAVAPVVAVRETLAPRRNQRHFRGCLLGGAVGDALGAPAEFLSLPQLRARFGPEGVQEMEEAYGRVGGGAITDDTQMTMFTAEGLLRANSRVMDRGVCDPATIVHHAYLRWLRTQDPHSEDPPFLAEAPGWLLGVRALHAQRAPGNSCLSALRHGRMGTVAEPVNDSKGCGGVMRVAPVALLTPGDPFADAAAIAAITHGHPSGYLAAGALAETLHHVLAGATLEHAVHEALMRLPRERGHEETSAALKAALTAWREGTPSADRVRRLGRGWVAEEALAIAVYCALAAGDDFAAGVRLAVNHSGDSDSTGAIAGQLLGARLGVGAIPARWLQRLELRAELEALADDLLVGWREGEAWRRRYPPN